MNNQIASPSLPSQFIPSSVGATTNAYTDLNSLNAIKNEESEDEALKKVAKQFESLFMHELLKNMRNANSVFEEDSLLDNKESNFFRDMYDQQLSITLSEKGMGLSDVLYRQMKASYGTEDGASTKPNITGKIEFGSDRPPKIKVRSKPLEENSTPRVLPSDASQSSDKNLTSFDSAKDFVDSVLPMAKKALSAMGLNPLMAVAQSALETGWGKHIIKGEGGVSSNNLFNIKAGAGWQGEKVAVTTTEYRDGTAVKEQAFFRKYDSIEDSVKDFMSFLKDNPRYQKALDVADDANKFIQGLQKAGYATDPEYANKIMSVFNKLSTTTISASKALGG